MNFFAFRAPHAPLTLSLFLAGCSLATSLDGLTGGETDASTEAQDASLPAVDATSGDACGSCALDAGRGSDANLGDSAQSPSEAGVADGHAGADTGSSDASLPLDGASPSDASSDVVSSPPDAGLCTPAAPTSLDVCTGFGPLDAPPVIDGVLDCGVPLWSMPVVVSSGPGPLPSGARALIGAAWRPDGLYLFVSVSGLGATRSPAPPNDPAWCGDAIELFVDHDGIFPNAPKYDDPGTIQLVAASPANPGQPAHRGEMFRDGSDLGGWSGQFVNVATSDGFTTEAFITAADLGVATWSLGAGGSVGLDVSVDLGSPSQPASCPRLGQFTIQLPQVTAGNCAAGCDVGEFCTPLLQ